MVLVDRGAYITFSKFRLVSMILKKRTSEMSFINKESNIYNESNISTDSESESCFVSENESENLEELGISPFMFEPSGCTVNTIEEEGSLENKTTNIGNENDRTGDTSSVKNVWRMSSYGITRRMYLLQGKLVMEQSSKIGVFLQNVMISAYLNFE